MSEDTKENEEKVGLPCGGKGICYADYVADTIMQAATFKEFSFHAFRRFVVELILPACAYASKNDLCKTGCPYVREE